jgi:hypothetical protein
MYYLLEIKLLIQITKNRYNCLNMSKILNAYYMYNLIKWYMMFYSLIIKRLEFILGKRMLIMFR